MDESLIKVCARWTRRAITHCLGVVPWVTRYARVKDDVVMLQTLARSAMEKDCSSSRAT